MESPAPASDLPLSRRARAAVDQPIAYLMREAVANPGLISLAAGLVDAPSLPAGPVRRIVDEMLADTDAAQAALQYGETAGLAPLRQALFNHLAALDGLDPQAMAGSAEDVVVTTGSQQLLHLLAEVLLDPGDIVITARPTYFVFTGFLPSLGVSVRGVPMDAGGMRLEELDAMLSAIQAVGHLRRVKMVYLCSYHQNPSGVSFAEDRKGPLVELVQRWSVKLGRRILIVDDAAYRELTYEAPALGGGVLPSIRRHDTGGEHVALLHTLSKPFAPGLKTGYGLLPSDLVEPILRAKGGRDFGSNNFAQHVLWRAMQSGAFAEHVAALRDLYRVKRDAMLTALRRHLGDVPGVSWTTPAGGLYVWLTLPESIDTGRSGPLLGRAIEAGVLFVPGAYCYPPDPGRWTPSHELRLSYGVASVERIEQGIERLAGAVRGVLAG